MFEPSVTILGEDHEYKKLEKLRFFIKDNSNRSVLIIIEDDVWIGENVTILKGVTIKQGSIIIASSVVNKDVEAFTIVSGFLAVKINIRFNMKENFI